MADFDRVRRYANRRWTLWTLFNWSIWIVHGLIIHVVNTIVNYPCGILGWQVSGQIEYWGQKISDRLLVDTKAYEFGMSGVTDMTNANGLFIYVYFMMKFPHSCTGWYHRGNLLSLDKGKQLRHYLSGQTGQSLLYCLLSPAMGICLVSCPSLTYLQSAIILELKFNKLQSRQGTF